MEPFSPYQAYPHSPFLANAGCSDPHISVYVPPSPVDGSYGSKSYSGYRDNAPYPPGRSQRDGYPFPIAEGVRRSSMGDGIDMNYPYDSSYPTDPLLNRRSYAPGPPYGPVDYGRHHPSSQVVYSSGPVRFPNRTGPVTKYGFRPKTSDSTIRAPKIRPTDFKRPRMISEPDSRSSPRPSAFYCELCKVNCVGATAFADHQKGQRHQKRLAQHNAIEQLKSNKSDVVVKASPKTGATELRCELCDVACTGAEAYSAHLAGRQHKRILRLHKELGKPIPATSDPLVPTEVVEALTTSPRKSDQEKEEKPAVINGASSERASDQSPSTCVPELQNVDLNLLKAQNKLPVGAEYVEQVIGAGGKGVYYQCKLCECQFTSADAKDMHLKGRRHRSQYKKKVDPSFEVERKPSTSKASRKAAQVAKRQDINFPAPVLPVMPGPRVAPVPYAEPVSVFSPQPLFGRSPFNIMSTSRFPASPQHLNVVIENRLMSAKHASLVPTETEAQAMKTVITVCEHALKAISDDLVAESASTAGKMSHDMEKSSDTDDESHGTDPESGRVGADDAQANHCRDANGNTNAEIVEDRLLRGVVRVGPLGKSLLLRGEHSGDLVLVCSAWPTTRLLDYMCQELPGALLNLDTQFVYELSTDNTAGLITVRVSKKADTEKESSNKTSSDWPSITVRIQLTSPVVVEDDIAPDQSSHSSGAVKAASSNQSVDSSTASTATEQTRHSICMSHTISTTTSSAGTQGPSKPAVVPANRLSLAYQLIAEGEPISKNNCVDALDAINQAKWFQNALNKQPLGLVSRVLLDFIRADEKWHQLDEFAVLALLDRLLSLELQAIGRSSGPRSFTRSGQPLSSSHGYVGPSRLFRRFFEAISSGLLLQLKTGITMDEEISGENGFFAYGMLAELSLELMEKITTSAQLVLRQIAFRQLHKVLRMESNATQFAYRRRVSPDDDNAEKVDDNSDDDEVDVNDQLSKVVKGAVGDSSGAPPKRPCIESTTQKSSSKSASSISVTTTRTEVETGSPTPTHEIGSDDSLRVATRASIRLSAGSKKA